MFTFLAASSLSLLYLLFRVGTRAQVSRFVSAPVIQAHILICAFLSNTYTSPRLTFLLCLYNVARSQTNMGLQFNVSRGSPKTTNPKRKRRGKERGV